MITYRTWAPPKFGGRWVRPRSGLLLLDHRPAFSQAAQQCGRSPELQEMTRTSFGDFGATALLPLSASGSCATQWKSAVLPPLPSPNYTRHQGKTNSTKVRRKSRALGSCPGMGGCSGLGRQWVPGVDRHRRGTRPRQGYRDDQHRGDRRQDADRSAQRSNCNSPTSRSMTPNWSSMSTRLLDGSHSARRAY